MKRNLTLFVAILLIIIIGGAYYLGTLHGTGPETIPRQTGTSTTKTEPAQLPDLIVLDSPRPGANVMSPLQIKGRARGTWFFEASFPVVLTDWDGRIIAEGIASARGDWMTEDYVPFEATLTFTTDPQPYSNRGSLILKKDNPSGLPGNDVALEVPIIFTKTSAGGGDRNKEVPPLACPTIAKLCPDGSSVSPTGPNCEFAPCPEPTSPPVSTSCTTNADCPDKYECVPGCGSPVSYEGEPPAPSSCQPLGYIRNCPICLSGGTLIDTPDGPEPVESLASGDIVWTTNLLGQRVASPIIKVGHTSVPATHQMVALQLADGRTLSVSPGHPTNAGLAVGSLQIGDSYDHSIVTNTKLFPYSGNYTYDLLPAGATGLYFANGILLGSTLR